MQYSCCESEDDDECTRLNEINAWFKSQKVNIELKDLSGKSNGDRHPQLVICAAGINYWQASTEKQFLNFIKSLDWHEPQQLVILFTTEEKATKVWRIPQKP